VKQLNDTSVNRGQHGHWVLRRRLQQNRRPRLTGGIWVHWGRKVGRTVAQWQAHVACGRLGRSVLLLCHGLHVVSDVTVPDMSTLPPLFWSRWRLIQRLSAVPWLVARSGPASGAWPTLPADRRPQDINLSGDLQREVCGASACR